MPPDVPAGAQADVLALLATGELTVEGRVLTASNLTLYARVEGAGGTLPCVYKPVSGERPLWDFPDGTLAGREAAAYTVSRAGGWDLVPPTVVRDGPLGPGTCQQWVAVSDTDPPVALHPGSAAGPGWVEVVAGEDGRGREVVLAHRDEPALRAMAVLDAVLNNADRKGGHVLRRGDGSIVGVDHGLCFHAEPKLRTVLWGWRGEPLTAREREVLAGLAAAWPSLGLDDWLTPREVEAGLARVRGLLADGTLPLPGQGWPSLPWPAF
jgi:uncharacterized repeat protein (TIGR03843 family)